MRYNTIRTIILIPLLFLAGCTPQVISLQNVNVSSLDKKTPLHITDSRTENPLIIQAGISVNNHYYLKTNVDKHTPVNSKGIYEIEPVTGEKFFVEKGGVNIYDFAGNNFKWTLPHIQASLNADLVLSKYFSLYFGGSGAIINDKLLTGLNGGIGLVCLESETIGLRFDFGIDYYQTSYESQIVQYEDKVLTENDTRKVYFTDLSGDDYNTNLNFSVCLNTKKKDWFLNYFLNYSYGLHTFYDFNSTDNIEARAKFIGDPGNGNYSVPVKQYATGIYRNIDDKIRAIGGFRYTQHNDNKKNLQSFDTFIQFDFLLF